MMRHFHELGLRSVEASKKFQLLAKPGFNYIICTVMYCTCMIHDCTCMIHVT